MKLKNWFVTLIALFAVGGFVASLIFFPWISVIPAAIAVWSISVLNKRRKQNPRARRVINWSKVAKVFSIILMVLFAILSVPVAIFFGWWVLLTIALFLGALIWFLALVGKMVIKWHVVLIGLLLVVIILLGVFWLLKGGINVLNVDEINADVINVTEQNVTKQNVTEQNVTKQNVTEQNVTKQNVTEQNVTKQNVTEQNVTKQNVTEQNVTEQNVTKQNVTEQNATNVNTTQPTQKPTEPTQKPTTQPTQKPTEPTEKPTTQPTQKPTEPTQKPTEPVHKHCYSKKVTNPTCTEKGYTTYTCSCGDSYVGDYVDKLGHNYKSQVVAPTTTSEGYTKHTCSRCGHSYKDSYTDKLPEPVAPSFTLVESGNGYWVVKFEGMVSSNIDLDDDTKGHIEWLAEDTLKVVKDFSGKCYFSLTDDVSGEVIYLF